MIRAWEKLELPCRATPFSPLLAVAFGALFQAWGLPDVGLCMIIGFFAFLRTGELFMLRPGCIVIADDGSEAVITLTDTKGVARRQGPHVDRIVLKQPIAILALRLACKDKLPGDPLMAISLPGFRKLWARAIAHFNIQQFHYLPYSLRRGGATHHFRVTNSMDAVMVIGRWQHAKTCRLYVEDGLLTLANLSLGTEIKKFLRATAEPLRRQLGAAPLE